MEISNISIDMIRLSTRVDGENFMDFIQYLLDAGKFHNKYWTSYRESGFRHNWVITQEKINEGIEKEYIEENFFHEQQITKIVEKIKNEKEIDIGGSYYIGLQHNMNSPKDKKTFVIEYNPNKIIVDEMLKEILKYVFQFNYKDLYINSFDCAIDYKGYNTCDVYYDKTYYKNSKIFDYNGNKTIYIGETTKLYNKGIESNLEYELLRYEIRFKEKIEVDKVKEHKLTTTLTDIYINSKIDDKSISAIDRAVIYSIRNGFDINELTDKYRYKIKKLISPDKLSIEKEQIKECLVKYMYKLKKELNINMITSKEIENNENEVKTMEEIKKEIEKRENIEIKEKDMYYTRNWCKKPPIFKQDK